MGENKSPLPINPSIPAFYTLERDNKKYSLHLYTPRQRAM